MNKKINKKGFTIVELVVVIVVIAILAAVLIPTYKGLVDKANVSADEQAVRQMNTILAMHDSDNTIKTVADAVTVLRAENIELEDYKALSKNHYFYFVLDNNENGRIILADKDNNILYPEDISLPKNAQWMSLSGDVPTDDAWEDTTEDDNTKATITSGAQFADFMESYADGDDKATQVTEIVLEGNVDLKGAAVNFGKVTENVKISASEDAPATLAGLRADSNTAFGSGVYADKGYGYGLFGDVQNLTIENVTFSGLNVGDTQNIKNGTLGLIAGYVYGTLTLRNVTFEDCTVFGYDKVGGIVGQLKGNLVLENVTFKDTDVKGSSYTAALAGLAYAGSSITVDADCDLRGITVSVYEPSLKAWGESGPTMENVITDGDTTYIKHSSSGYECWDCTTNKWCWKAGQITAEADGKRYITVGGDRLIHAGSCAPYTGALTVPRGE